MIAKLSKSILVAIALLASLSPAGWSQENVDTVHISQPKTQDLGESWSGSGRGLRGNGSFGSGSGSSGGFGGLGYRGGSNGYRGNSSNDDGNGFGGLGFGRSGSSLSRDGGSGRNGGGNGSNGGGSNGHGGNNGSGNNGGGGPGFGGNNQPNPGGGSIGGNQNPGNNVAIGSCGGNCGGCAGKCGGSTGCGNNGCGCPQHNNNNNNNGGGGGGAAMSDGGGPGLCCPQSNQKEAMQEFCNKGAVGSLDKSWPGGNVAHQNNGQGPEVSNKQNTEQISGQTWPHVLPGFPAQFPPMGQAVYQSMPKSLTQGPASMTPPSASELTTMMTQSQNAAIESMFQPNSWLQTAKEVQNTQTQANADNAANMEKQQAGSAIDFVRSALENFTVDAGNQWNRLRNELFLPMAVLLLLPGAVATQAKATVAQGFPIFGEVSPVEGIYRSIVSIFLIPGTYLIVNYGIDVSNSIAYTIQSEYFRIFGSDMYRDAMCAHIRAFGSRLPAENKGYIPQQAGEMQGKGKGPRAKFEGKNLDVKLEDPCAGLYEAPESKANEKVPYAVNSQRAGYNGMGAALAMTWNILCAFQMCYLYYLWFVGPIMAALWVWPVKQLRDAFPSWCEGVITICFWSLFWNTTVLLMACFRGIDDTGTVIMEALNFLSTACVKFAFDFAGLVKAAGAEAGKMAEKAAKGGGAKGGAPSGNRGSNPGGRTPSAPQGAPNREGPTPPSASSVSPAIAGTESHDRAGSFQPGQNERTVNTSAPPTTYSSETVASGYNSDNSRAGAVNVDMPGGFTTSAPTISNSSTGVGAIDVGTPPTVDAKAVDASGLAGLPGIAGAAGLAAISAESTSTNKGVDATNDATKQLSQQMKDQMMTDALTKQTQQSQEATQIAQAQAQEKAGLAQAQAQQEFNEKALIASLGAQANSQLSTPEGKNAQPDVAAAQASAISTVSSTMSNFDSALTGNMTGMQTPGIQNDPSLIRTGFNSDPILNPVGTQALNLNDASLNAGTINTQGTGGIADYARNAIIDPTTGMPISGSIVNVSGSATPSDPMSYTAGTIPIGGSAYPVGTTDANTILPANAQTPQIIDVPGGTNKISIDVPGGSNSTESASNFARTSNDDIINLGYTAGTVSYASDSSLNYGSSALNMTGSQSQERSSLDAGVAGAASEIPLLMNSQGYVQPPSAGVTPEPQQTIYRQQQDTVIEERRQTPNKPEPQDQARRVMNQNQKQIDQQRMNQAGSGAPPATGQQQGQQGGPPGTRPSQQHQRQAAPNQPEQQISETQRQADTPLAEQVQYGSILRRSRDTNEMSEEELELMRKLGQSDDDEEQPQPED